MPPFHCAHPPGPSLGRRVLLEWYLLGRRMRTPCHHHNQSQQRRVLYQTAQRPPTPLLQLPAGVPSSSSLGCRIDSRATTKTRRSTIISAAATTPAMAATQTRGHAGHGHGHHHHHHHDNVYLTSRNKNDAGVRITRIGLAANLGMAIAKGAGGYMFNSQAMVADAWHSLSDLGSDILTLATVTWSLRPPSDRYPTGFGKVESLGSLGVSGMLFFGGLFMCYSSLGTLYAHFFLDPAAAAEFMAHAHHGHSHGALGHDHGHGHGHGHGHIGPSLNAAWLAAGTVVVKEWLYHATMKVARERKSSVLASNAVHHRVDSLTGIVTLLVVLGANFWHSAQWLDPTGGLLISLLVIRAGFGNTIAALQELADRSIDEEIKQSVRKQTIKAVDALEEGLVMTADRRREVELREVSGVKSGQNYLVDLELSVPGRWTVEECRAVEDAVRTRVGGKVRGVRRVRVRFVQSEAVETRKFDEFIPGEVSPRASPEPEEERDHDHDHGHSHANGKGDNSHPKSN
ncbi:mitochondrial metal transporter 2 [Magnaporthiopsis poae ATCC 64411]|uniref:Mitochondrial metal transporter 2 n=1 Tax=Magnaporthiopsis poae (strain ATCC 64411 / 73-15) TaxID=644358 RepID=A0A0C4DTK4_MAGP6|nr:mitochondrial metal transporter 2 [Magnaporthiopsis poae ATCC 64411]